MPAKSPDPSLEQKIQPFPFVLFGHEKLPFKETLNDIPAQKNYIDRKGLGINSVNTKPYNSVMKNLAERIKG